MSSKLTLGAESFFLEVNVDYFDRGYGDIELLIILVIISVAGMIELVTKLSQYA